MDGGVGEQAELGEDPLGVLLHGPLGDHHDLGDAGVGVALGHEGQDLPLAGRELGERVVAPASLEDLGDDVGVQDELAARHPLDRAEEGVDVADPNWASIKAVQDQKVYVNPKGVFGWDRYGVEELLQVQWVSALLHPDLFPDFKIEEKVKTFCKTYLNYSLTDDEVKLIMAGKDPQ